MGKLGRVRRMEKRVAIVTGAGGGLGKATAERLFKDGFSMAVVDRDGATAREVAETLDSRGKTARVYTLDVSSVSDVAVTITAISSDLAPGLIEVRDDQVSKAYRDQYLTMIPRGRMGRAPDIVGTVVFLLSSDADFINGECIVVDGGFLTGRPLDRAQTQVT